MTMRTRRETVHFRHPFRIKGIDRQLPGAYEIITDEEMIEGLSFPCFRRVATMIMVPGAPPQRSAMEMISISSIDLSDAHASTRARRVTETPIELDKHRGMAEQKATDIRRVIAEVEANAKLLRDKQGVVESRSSPRRPSRGPRRWPRPATSSISTRPASRRPTRITAIL